MKIDPIIAVKDVEESSKWYQTVFGWDSKHGGNEFDILTTKAGEVTICLHKWGEHEHPTMKSSTVNRGNGLILYFRTENIEEIREKLNAMDYLVEREIQLSQNSNKREFSLRDPDGYHISIAEYHEYEG